LSIKAIMTNTNIITPYRGTSSTNTQWAKWNLS